MKIIQPEVTIQPEVVEPNWVEAALHNLVEKTKPDYDYVIPETSYLLSREESDRLIGSLTGSAWDMHIPGQWTEYDIETIHNDQLRHPRKTDENGNFRVTKGLYRCSSSCARCPSPFQDVKRGIEEYQKRMYEIHLLKEAGRAEAADKLKQSVFPHRCKPCRRLYSSRYRGRKAAGQLETLALIFNWKFTHWIHTKKVRVKSSPWTENEIMEEKRKDMRLLSRLYESVEWYPVFTGIQVYEAKVRAPGDIVTGTRRDGSDYNREVTGFELHGHIHACIIHPKDGFVDVKKIRSKFFEGSVYKNKYENHKDTGEERSVGKIIGDYLVGYLRKDIVGNMGWCGPREYRFKTIKDTGKIPGRD